jgi:cell fate (sporulation/competence/biofilm development) regulator YlbF (YheA/YmcA/DUF963 family)
MYYCSMRDILEKANELGLLIKGSDECKRYESLEMEIEKAHTSGELLDHYEKLAEEIKSRELNGDIIEKFEREELGNLAEEISGDDLICRYIKAKEDYINLLLSIQSSINKK